MNQTLEVPSAEPVIRVRGLGVEQGGETLLSDVSFSVNHGRIAVILGPSGSGKTTLLRCLNGLQPPHAGKVEVLGFDTGCGSGGAYPSIDALRQDVGFVQQELFLWPHKPVLENLTEAPIRVRREPVATASARALQWLERFGLVDKAHSLPHRLSQGQRQRVAICRALMMEPKLLLLDEVTSALDVEWSVALVQILKQLAGEGRSFVFVTHQLGLASEVSDDVLFLDSGRLLEATSTGIFFRAPTSRRAKEFLQLASVRIGE